MTLVYGEPTNVHHRAKIVLHKQAQQPDALDCAAFTRDYLRAVQLGMIARDEHVAPANRWVQEGHA